MARQFTVSVFCDICLNGPDGEVKTPGEEVTGGLGELGGRPQVIALCEPHRKELYDPWLEALREYGQKVGSEATVGAKKGGRPSKAELTCPECGYQAQSKQGLGAHKRTHLESAGGE